MNSDDMTPAEERADYIKTMAADRGITLYPSRDHKWYGFTWCAFATRDGKEFHACGKGEDAYEALGNMLEVLASRPT